MVKQLEEMDANIIKIGESISNGSERAKSEAIEFIYNRISNSVNDPSNPVNADFESLKDAITQYSHLASEIASKQRLMDLSTDSITKLNLNGEVEVLRHQVELKLSIINSKISSFDHNLVIAKSKILEILDEIGRNNSNFIDKDSIYRIIESYNNYLGSLDYPQIIAITNLFGIFVIIVSLFSIVSIFFGNKILDYLNLEAKYPRFAKFIILRRKFQQYYLFIDLILITIVSITMFLLNLTLLF